MGTDVILAHRMMKNYVKEITGLKSYLLITNTALEKLNVNTKEHDLTAISQVYEHIGAVEMEVLALQQF